VVQPQAEVATTATVNPATAALVELGGQPLVSIASLHRLRQQALAAKAKAAAARYWRQVDPAQAVTSWDQTASRGMVATLTAVQAEAARGAQGYVAVALGEQGATPDPSGTVSLRAFAGVAADGRDLVSLLAQPALEVDAFVRQGMDPGSAGAIGLRHLQRIAVNEAQDATRVSTGVAMVNDRSATGYIRMLTPPSCSRCVLLAGRWYRYDAGFLRHPQCDCVGVPAAQAPEIASPEQVFKSMSDAELAKAGWNKSDIDAIRSGADIYQVTNAKRELQSVTVAGRQVQITLVGTGRRGLAGQRLGIKRGQKVVRLTPATLYVQAKRAGWSRDELLTQLWRHGYIL
jgi:hypothetical protein